MVLLKNQSNKALFNLTSTVEYPPSKSDSLKLTCQVLALQARTSSTLSNDYHPTSAGKTPAPNRHLTPRFTTDSPKTSDDRRIIEQLFHTLYNLHLYQIRTHPVKENAQIL